MNQIPQQPGVIPGLFLCFCQSLWTLPLSASQPLPHLPHNPVPPLHGVFQHTAPDQAPAPSAAQTAAPSGLSRSRSWSHDWRIRSSWSDISSPAARTAQPTLPCRSRTDKSTAAPRASPPATHKAQSPAAKPPDAQTASPSDPSDTPSRQPLPF